MLEKRKKSAATKNREDLRYMGDGVAELGGVMLYCLPGSYSFYLFFHSF